MQDSTSTDGTPYDLLEKALKDSEYSPEAFDFVREAVRVGPYLHVDAEEFCWILHDRAIHQFGPHARRRLADWGICSCLDFGKIVYTLIHCGLMERSEEDSLEDFQRGFDFANAFTEYKNPPKPFQWRISTMFLITTVMAILFAGASQAGISGAMGTVLGAWLMLIGFICSYLGGDEEPRSRQFGILVGLALAILGAIIFLTVLYGGVRKSDSDDARHWHRQWHTDETCEKVNKLLKIG